MEERPRHEAHLADDAEHSAASTIHGGNSKGYGSLLRVRLLTLQRVFAGVVLSIFAILCLLTLTQWRALFELSTISSEDLRKQMLDAENLRAQRSRVWRNCRNLEPLRLLDDCIEAYEFEKPTQRNIYNPTRGVFPTFESGFNFLSAYGLVLDYGIAYAPKEPPKPPRRIWRKKQKKISASVLTPYAPPPDMAPYRPLVKRTLKCNLPQPGNDSDISNPAHALSIVWDILYRPPPLLAAEVAMHGENMSYANRTHPSHPITCPGESDAEPEVVFNIWINCAQNIRRNFLGGPLDDKAKGIRQKCFETAWLWARWVGIDVHGLDAWSEMCQVKPKTKTRKSKRQNKKKRPPHRPKPFKPSTEGQMPPEEKQPDIAVNAGPEAGEPGGVAEYTTEHKDKDDPTSEETDQSQESEEEDLECAGRGWHMEFGWKKIEVT